MPEQIRLVEEPFHCVLCHEHKLVGVEFWYTTPPGDDLKLCEDCLGTAAGLLGYVFDKVAQEHIVRLEATAQANSDELVKLRKLVADIRTALRAIGGVEGSDSHQARGGRTARAKAKEPALS